MADSLVYKLQDIKEDKNTNLKPENLKAGVTCLGVEGTMQSGVDTSDATATIFDIVYGKTAYGPNGKMTGTIMNNASYSPQFVDTNVNVSTKQVKKSLEDPTMIDVLEFSNQNLNKSVQKYLYTNIELNAEFADVANVIGLTADKILEGNTILGIVGTVKVLDTSDATATAEDISLNKTAYANGQKITGSLPLFPNSRTFTVDGGITNDAENNRIQIHTINTTKQILDSNLNMEFNGEYADVANAIGLTADKIKAGETILGIEGTASTGINTSDATATVKDILAGKTAYVDGEKLEGTMTNNGDLIITPSTDEQDHSAGYYNSIQVRPVTSSVDTNIKAENIKSGISILGVSGSLIELNGHELEVTPSTVQKVIEPEENYNAITRVTVEAVTSSIDPNITPENIKSGVSILGVNGTYNGDNINDYISLPEGETAITIAGCIKQIPQLDTSAVTSMSSMFSTCTSLTTIPLLNTSKVTSMSSMFFNCISLTTIPQLDTSAVTSMNNMFSNCTSLTTIPQLDTSKVTGMSSMFYNCKSLSNDSLNNILAMLTNATAYTGTKTLKYISLSETQATTCTTLSNWAECETAGWTTGY